MRGPRTVRQLKTTTRLRLKDTLQFRTDRTDDGLYMSKVEYPNLPFRGRGETRESAEGNLRYRLYEQYDILKEHHEDSPYMQKHWRLIRQIVEEVQAA